MTTQDPNFTLALQDGVFELRDYAARVVAEVTVQGNQALAGRTGFRQLAGYIFGGNATARKIAMTTPVTKQATAPVAGGLAEWLVRFAMPEGLALDDLPVPNSPHIHLRSLPPDRYAVRRSSGMAGQVRVAEETAALMATAKARGLLAIGPVSIATYNPPWTPWFLRRNEVMLPVISGGA